MPRIQTISALEILDSHGNPTVRVSVALNNGITASACVPSGASTGIREALELRDGDRQAFAFSSQMQAGSGEWACTEDDDCCCNRPRNFARLRWPRASVRRRRRDPLVHLDDCVWDSERAA